MKNKILTYISVCLLFAVGLMQAQTTNEGEFIVSENTILSTLGAFENTPTGTFYNDGDTYIYKGFNNEGIVDFTQETGLTRFVGSQSQNLSGSQPSYFYDILFDNTSQSTPFLLSGEFDVFGSVDFYNGVVDNKNYEGTLIFEENTTHFNTSDYSHVNGPVQKFGEEEFTFPIGEEGYYRFSRIAAPESLDLFISEYHFENSDENYPHHLREGVLENLNDQEYWTITHPEMPEDTQQFITLSYRAETTPEEFMQAAEEDLMTIVRWDEETNMWIDEGGTVNHDDQTITTPVEKFGIFTFGTLEDDLLQPCHIVVYNAVTANGDGSNDYFRIEDEGDCAEALHVKIYNRWGVKVFESYDYGPDSGEVFDGYSTGRITVKDENNLPDGTYFYTLEYEYDTGEDFKTHKKAGYLYLNGQ